MAYPEYRNSIPTQDALREWLSNGMTDGPLSSSLIPQVAPNRHINDYRIETKDGIFFVKVYLDTPEVAEREVKISNILKACHLFLSLDITFSQMKANNA